MVDPSLAVAVLSLSGSRGNQPGDIEDRPAGVDVEELLGVNLDTEVPLASALTSLSHSGSTVAASSSVLLF